MPLQPANLLSNGYIVPNRFVMIDPTSTQPTTSLGGQGGFHVIQAVAAGTSISNAIAAGYAGQTIGISADGTNYPPINDPTIFPSGILAIAAAPGQWIKIFGVGSTDVLLEMAAACNPGDLLSPTGTNANLTLSSGALQDANAGRGTPITTISTPGTQEAIFYGARAIQACTGATGEKIRVDILEGWYKHS